MKTPGVSTQAYSILDVYNELRTFTRDELWLFVQNVRRVSAAIATVAHGILSWMTSLPASVQRCLMESKDDPKIVGWCVRNIAGTHFFMDTTVEGATEMFLEHMGYHPNYNMIEPIFKEDQ